MSAINDVLARLCEHARSSHAFIRIESPDPFVTWECPARGNWIAQLVRSTDNGDSIEAEAVGRTMASAVLKLSQQMKAEPEQRKERAPC